MEYSLKWVGGSKKYLSEVVRSQSNSWLNARVIVSIASYFLFHCWWKKIICNYTIISLTGRSAHLKFRIPHFPFLWFIFLLFFHFCLKMIFMSLWIYEVRFSLFHFSRVSLHLALSFIIWNWCTHSHMHKMLIWNIGHK